VRIIAGRLRGRRLAAVPPGVRPTSDRVRESVFARLGDLTGARVLDLYCGTGALGIEAISRGAESLVCVDRSGRSIAATTRNLAALGIADEARVVKRDARGAVRRLADERACFDLILIDAPYADFDGVGPLLASIVEGGLVARGGVVVVECAKRHAVPPIEGLAVETTRSYGDTSITWLVRSDADDATGGIAQE
jgi:16S rRNA (guanine966-N2)-methyltransferase